MRLIVVRNSHIGMKKRRGALRAFLTAVVMVAVFSIGAFLGGVFVRNSDEAFYSKLQEDLKTVEYYADLTALIDFAEGTFYEEITREVLIEYACRGVIDNLDPYSQLLTKADRDYIEQSASLASLYGKIGLTVSFIEAGRFCVREVAEGSPAYYYNQTVQSLDKIMPGDYIKRVNGYDVEGLYQADLTSLLSGFIGDAVTLDLYHDYTNGRVEKNGITLVRQSFYSSETYTILDFDDYISGMGANVPDDIGYIRLNSFSGSAGTDFANAINAFQSAGKTKLILDLRGNGGGSGNIMCEIASYLIDDSTHSESQEVITLYFKNGQKFIEKTPANNYIYHGKTPRKIAVLVDGSTASASECVIGAMISSNPVGLTGGTCELFGTPTFGKGIGQFTYSLDSVKEDEEYQVKLSVGEYTFRGDVSAYVSGANGPVNSIHGVGFTPKSQYIAQTVSPTLLGDEAFEMAVNFLRRQV